LPDWPFLGQNSKIWPRFKLVGLKNFSLPFGSVWPNLKLVGLKKLAWPFYTDIGSMKENITIPIF